LSNLIETYLEKENDLDEKNGVKIEEEVLKNTLLLSQRYSMG